MKITAAQIEKLLLLAGGNSLPSSALKGNWFEPLVADHVVVAVTRGSRLSFRAQDGAALRRYVASHFEVFDMEATLSLLKAESADRAEQVRVGGNSKLRRQRTFQGFLVNCYHSIPATLINQPLTLNIADGTFLFVYDYRRFSIPEDVVVVGVENAENFRFIHRQKALFEACLPGKKLLFVSRYPQQQSHDLRQWLGSIANRYVHFGDLDLAGVHIYLSEYFAYLGSRASMLIPPDYERLICQGSRERYEAQYAQYGKMKLTDSRVSSLVDCIHKHHRGYDQEGLIELKIKN